MKTFTFTFSSGWIGGHGVVVSETKEKALELVNAELPSVPLGIQDKIDLDDLVEVMDSEVKIISNGDY